MGRKCWGIYLIMFGLGTMFNFSGIFSIFFNGWWTLLLIIPAAINLFAQKDKLINTLTLLAGVFLFFYEQNFTGNMFWKIIFSLIFVVIGINSIFYKNPKTK